MSDRYQPHDRSVHTEDCHFPEWKRVTPDTVQCESCGVIVTPQQPERSEATQHA